MKRCGPPMTDRRCKRLQTRHEVERAAQEDQVDDEPGTKHEQLQLPLKLITFGSVCLEVYYGDPYGLEQFTVRCMERMGSDRLTALLKFGGWMLKDGRMHLGYLVDKDTSRGVNLVGAKALAQRAVRMARR